MDAETDGIDAGADYVGGEYIGGGVVAEDEIEFAGDVE